MRSSTVATTVVALLSLLCSTSCKDFSRDTVISAADFRVDPARANQAALSPDGTNMVFTLMGRVFVGPAGGGEARLVGGQGFASWPAWTADGEHILFSDGPGNVLYEIDLDGNSRRLMQESGERASGSADGRLIAFIRNDELWLLERDDGKERLVAADVFPGTFPVWSPLGRELLFVRGLPVQPDTRSIDAVDVTQPGFPARTVADMPGAQRFAVSSDGSSVAVLRWRGDDFTTENPFYAFQAWTTDSTFKELVRVTDIELLQWQVFNRFPSGDFLVTTGDALLRVSVDGSTVDTIEFRVPVELDYVEHSAPRIRLAEPGSRRPVEGIASPRISPDGRSVAFSALGDIWIASLSGDGPEPQRFSHAAHDMQPWWFPSGDRLAFVSDRGGDYDIWVLDAESGEAQRVTFLSGEETIPSISPSGEWIAFSFFDGGDRNQLTIVRPDGSSLRHIGRTSSLAKAEPIAGWLPDGSAVLIPITGVRAGVEGERLRAVPLDGDTPYDVSAWPNWARRVAWPAVSLNRVAFESREQLWVQSVAEGELAGEPRLVGDGLGYWASLSADGNRLFHLGPAGPILHDLAEGTSRPIDIGLSYEVLSTPPLVLTNARIVGRGEQRYEIRLEGSRIAAISSADDATGSPEAETLDLAGRFVIPGLIDGHVHLGPKSYLRNSFLAFGVTTVVDMGSEPLACLAFNEAFASGALSGPRIVYAGDVVSQGSYVGSNWRPLVDEEEAARYMERQYALGARVLKLYAPLPALVEPLVRMARERGLYVTGHNAFPAATFGGHAAEHTQSVEETALLAAVGGSMTPTLITVDTFRGYAYWMRAAALEELVSRSDWWPSYAKEGIRQRISEQSPGETAPENPWVDRVGEAWYSGLRLHAGTDEGGLAAGLALHWELERLVDAGLSPSEALAAATSETARSLGLGSELGEVEVRYRADLVIVEADPLENIQNSQLIWKVIKDGRIVHER